MSVVPSRYVLGVRRFTTGAVDEFGNPTDSWADPTDWPVRSWSSTTATEPGAEHRDLSVVVFSIYADKSSEMPGVRDLVVIEGREYAVDGEPADWTHGPWENPAAGVTVFVRRAEG